MAHQIEEVTGAPVVTVTYDATGTFQNGRIASKVTRVVLEEGERPTTAVSVRTGAACAPEPVGSR